MSELQLRIVMWLSDKDVDDASSPDSLGTKSGLLAAEAAYFCRTPKELLVELKTLVSVQRSLMWIPTILLWTAKICIHRCEGTYCAKRGQPGEPASSTSS
jgi:hypothetical protein